MNDDFLYRIRPPLREAFAEELKQKLNRKYPDEKYAIETTRAGLFRWVWKPALLFILVALLLSFSFSGRVRADVVEWIRNIAGFQVQERFVPPVDDSGEPGALAKPTEEMTEASPTVYAVPTRSVEDLLRDMPFTFGLPKDVPEGFELQDNAAFANSKDWVMLVWSKENAEIAMLVERTYTGYYLPAGPDSAEEVQVDGAPALLIRGWWDENHLWDPGRRLELHWQKDERYYRLIYTQRSSSHWSIESIPGDIDGIVQELIKMAESVP
jgi:hypothetical protein